MNDKKIDRIVNERYNLLLNSNQDFKSIIEIMFKDKNYLFSEDNDGEVISKHYYGEVYNMILNAAYSINELYPNLKHEVIALAKDNSLSFIVSMFAIIASGNIPYLVNLRYPKSLINEILNDLNAKYIITDNDNYGLNKIDYNELNRNYPKDYKFDFENSLAISTSGTSLNRKIVFYNGKEVSEQLLNTKDILLNNKQIKKHYHGYIKQLMFLPLYHIFGLMATFMWFSFFGRCMVFLNDMSSDTIMFTIKKHEVTHIFAVPLFWETVKKHLLAEVEKEDEKTRNLFEKGLNKSIEIQRKYPNKGIGISKALLKKVTKKLFGKSVLFCISGGAMIKKDTLRLFNALGYPLYNGYGMSEVAITSVELDNIDRRMEGSIGLPFKSIEYKLENNELLVKGSSISHHLIINGEDKYINDEYFHTGDIVEFRNNRYFIMGRKDDLYISENGENVSPDTLMMEYNFKNISSFVILNLNNKLTLVIKISPYLSKDKIKEIYDYANLVTSKMDLSSRVKEIYFTYDEISNPNDIKVSRAYFMKLYNDNKISLKTYKDIYEIDNVKVSTKVLNSLKELISKCLLIDLDKINDDNDLFNDLGATSLDYYSLITDINNEFGIDFKFESASFLIKDMAQKIEEEIK
jgi:acyl carrier protein